MPKRNYKKLPSNLGVCRYCRKDTYPDELGANLALEILAKNPPRRAAEPVRVYPCPHNRRVKRYHLTSKPLVREINESA